MTFELPGDAEAAGGGPPRPLGGLEVRLLGAVQVVRHGRSVPLGAKQRAVFTVLAWRPNAVVARSDIVKLAWGTDPPTTVERLVADYVSQLRRAGLRGGGEPDAIRIVARWPGFVLEIDPTVVDWHRFEGLRRQARAAGLAGEAAAAAGLLHQALRLWRGPALADLPDACLDPIRQQLDGRRLDAAEDLAEIELTRGRPEQAVDVLVELAAGHPERERLAALLIDGLQATGRRDAAIGVYLRTRRHLTEQLGLDPTPALERAYRQVLDPVQAALVAPPRRLAQLPPDTSNFTGRDAELAELLTLPAHPGQRPPGVVSICAVDGMAGIGKTALAVRAAHRLAARYPDGCLFIDLHGYTAGVRPIEPGQALDRLLRALGTPAGQISPDLDEQTSAYRSLLADRRMLILLDNAASTDQIRPLLPASEGCLVLVTSRARLAALDDAHRLTLDIMPAVDATALFSRIAGSARVSTDPRTVEHIAELCGRLPLALRVAGARLRSRPAWTPHQLATLLADQHTRLSELDDGDRSITAAFTLSYQHLTPDQQHAFRLLGLHPGADTDIYAATALTDATLADTTTLLEALLDAHLLIQTTDRRYHLHDLIRAYAADLATAVEPEQTRRAALTRLFDHYLAVTAIAMDTFYPAEAHRRPRIRPPSSPGPPLATPAAARAWLDTERATLIAVAAHAATDGWPTHTILLATTVYRYLDAGGHSPDALTIHTHGRNAAHATGDHAAEGHALRDLGAVRWRQGQYDQAATYYRQALALFRQIGDRTGEARALGNLGLVHSRQGHHQRAADLHQMALLLYRDIGDPPGEARALDNLGLGFARDGRDQQAAQHHQDALTRCIEIGDRPGEARALVNLGAVAARQGRHEQAADHFHRGLALYREIGDRPGEAEALNHRGEALLAAGKPALARSQHGAALALATQIGDRYQQARAHDGLANAHVHDSAGDLGESRRHRQQALTLYADLGVPDGADVHPRPGAAGYVSSSDLPFTY